MPHRLIDQLEATGRNGRQTMGEGVKDGHTSQ
jgi:hypothetical protein